MLTTEAIKTKANNKYNSFLRALVEDINYFPLEIKGNKNFSTLDYTQAFDLFQKLNDNSKAKKGYGYSFSYEKTNKIKITKVYFETETDYLKFIKKETQTKTFKENIKILRRTLPISNQIIISNLSKILKWDVATCNNIALISSFIIKNPESNLYQRELPISVPTKFLEKNISTITSFISNFIELKNVDNKYQKLGLLDKSFIIKIRSKSNFNISDKNNKYCCSNDIIYLPPKAFEKFTHTAKRIFIVENETTFYNFPIQKDDLCLYSGGFSILSFKNNEYLKNSCLYYFGDLDEHGFAILSMFREKYNNVKSILMKMETLLFFKDFWIEGKTFTGSLLNLTHDETITLKYIKENNIRLEQEKIPISYISKEIATLK